MLRFEVLEQEELELEEFQEQQAAARSCTHTSGAPRCSRRHRRVFLCRRTQSKALLSAACSSGDPSRWPCRYGRSGATQQATSHLSGPAALHARRRGAGGGTAVYRLSAPYFRRIRGMMPKGSSAGQTVDPWVRKNVRGGSALKQNIPKHAQRSHTPLHATHKRTTHAHERASAHTNPRTHPVSPMRFPRNPSVHEAL